MTDEVGPAAKHPGADLRINAVVDRPIPGQNDSRIVAVLAQHNSAGIERTPGLTGHPAGERGAVDKAVTVEVKRIRHDGSSSR